MRFFCCQVYIVSSEINQKNIAIAGLNASCMSFLGHVFVILTSAKSKDITNFFVKSILVQKISKSSIYDIMSPEHFEIKKKDLRPL